jgi:hypothetical protein
MCFAPLFSSFFVFGAGVTSPRSSTLFLPGHAHEIAGQEQDDDFVGGYDLFMRIQICTPFMERCPRLSPDEP